MENHDHQPWNPPNPNGKISQGRPTECSEAEPETRRRASGKEARTSATSVPPGAPALLHKGAPRSLVAEAPTDSNAARWRAHKVGQSSPDSPSRPPTAPEESLLGALRDLASVSGSAAREGASVGTGWLNLGRRRRVCSEIVVTTGASV